MSGSNLNLKQLLKRLQKGAGFAPPTPDEADALMAGPEEASIDDARLLDIANAVVSGKPTTHPKESPAPWCEEDALSEAEREQFILNRNKGDLNEETRRQIDKAEQKALSDDDQDDDEDGMDGEANPS